MTEPNLIYPALAFIILIWLSDYYSLARWTLIIIVFITIIFILCIKISDFIDYFKERGN